MRILFLLLTSFLFAVHGYFVPPQGWEIAQLKNPSPYVQIGFIGKGPSDFRPSINLAHEATDCSLKEYVKTVKEQSSGQSRTRDLGKFSVKGGAGHLLEITQSNSFGEIRILQAFLEKQGHMYILTASVLKKDAPLFQTEILQSLKSLDIIEDLSAPIADEGQRESFQKLFSSLGKSEEKEEEWKSLQNQVKSLSQLGPHWQFVVLQEGHAKIFAKIDL